jgi:hypothetical protein
MLTHPDVTVACNIVKPIDPISSGCIKALCSSVETAVCLSAERSVCCGVPLPQMTS